MTGVIGRFQFAALRVDQVGDDADDAEEAAHRKCHVGPEHRDRFKAGHRLHAAALRVVPAPPDGHSDQRQRGQAHQPVEHAAQLRRAPAVEHIDADHRALPKGGRDAHEHHPDQADADQDLGPFGRLFQHEAGDDLKDAERRSDHQHEAGDRHGQARGPAV